jgi:hypothetical protein
MGGALNVNLSGWIEVLVAFGTLVTALGVLWSKILQPVVVFVVKLLEVVRMLPWLRRLKAASENLVERDKEKKP